MAQELPDIGEGVVEGEIVRWMVVPGDEIEEDQLLVEVMTDKANVEITSPIKGRIVETRGREGEIVAVGATLVVIEEAAGIKMPSVLHEHHEPPQPAQAAQNAAAATPPERAPLATPAVRKLARERGIDLAAVTGTGPGGRILPEDLDQFARKTLSTEALSPVSPGIEAIPYRGLRRKIGERLTLSRHRAVHYSYLEEAEVSALVALREAYLAGAPGRKLTYLPFVLKAVVSGLKRFPLLNSSLDEDQGEILVKKYYNIGIAAATPEGLIVPVIKGVDTKSLSQLSDEIRHLTEAARSGQIRLEDLQDGTFTVTSLGSLGGLSATPVINYPEVAILGVHKVDKRPVVRDGQIVIRDMMNLSISLDHRVIDGAVAAQFLHHVIRLLQNPALMLLEE